MSEMAEELTATAVSRIYKSARDGFSLVCRQIKLDTGEDTALGAYVCIYWYAQGNQGLSVECPILYFPIGFFTSGSIHTNLAQASALAAQLRRGGPGCYSSYGCEADESEGPPRRGGAIFCKIPELLFGAGRPATPSIVSCAGLTAHGNEALALYIAWVNHWPTARNIIVSLSKNTIAENMGLGVIGS